MPSDLVRLGESSLCPRAPLGQRVGSVPRHAGGFFIRRFPILQTLHSGDRGWLAKGVGIGDVRMSRERSG